MTENHPYIPPVPAGCSSRLCVISKPTGTAHAGMCRCVDDPKKLKLAVTQYRDRLELAEHLLTRDLESADPSVTLGMQVAMKLFMENRNEHQCQNATTATRKSD